MNPYTAETTGKVTTVRFQSVAAGWEQWVMLRSDAHHDSRLCDRDLEQAHLQTAAARNALILDGGDLFDAMQSRHDRRSSYDEIRPENATPDYFGSIVQHAAEDYAPYAPNWLLLAQGNHESGALNHTNLNLTTMLIDKMRDAGGKPQAGQYAGWVVLRFQIQETVIQTVKVRYFHGSGGAAPVTLGAIDTNRQAVYLPDADIVWNGHTHTSYLFYRARERCSQTGRVSQDLVTYIRTPGYKGQGLWEISKGFSPQPHGCAWLRFYLDAHSSMVKYDVMMELK
jgi:hypothetical protein